MSRSENRCVGLSLICSSAHGLIELGLELGLGLEVEVEVEVGVELEVEIG